MDSLLSTSSLRRTLEYARATGAIYPRILLVCPRRSGKTTALFNMFLEERNSVFMTTYGHATRSLRARAVRENPRGDSLIPMHDIVTLSGTSTLRGRMRRFSGLFIDDIQRYLGDWNYFHATVYPCFNDDGYVIATMTPDGNRGLEFYERYFNFVRHISDIPTLVRTDFDRNHFDEEDFTIE